LLYAQHIEQHGKGFFAEICARDLEGIVAKRKLSVYKDDGNTWLKVKNRTYSQAEGRHELLTRGGQVQSRRLFVSGTRGMHHTDPKRKKGAVKWQPTSNPLETLALSQR